MRVAVAILGVALMTTMAPVAAQEQGASILSTKTPVIAPSTQITHHLKVVTVPSCPAR